MSRIIRIGTPTELYRLQKRDLPDDHDLSYSYWRWVDFSGLDLSDYNMESMDIIDCKAHNVVLPDGGRTDFMVTRRTEWMDAKIPTDLSSFQGDLILEILRQQLPQLSGDHRIIAQIVIEVGEESYLNSWSQATQRCIERLGLEALSREEHLTALASRGAPLFAGYGRILRRLYKHYQTGSHRREGKPIPRTSVRVNERVLDLAADLSIVQYDRWAAARMLEQRIRQGYGENVQVYIGELWPSPRIFVNGNLEDRSPWWKEVTYREVDEQVVPKALRPE